MKTHINCVCGAKYMRKRGRCPECGTGRYLNVFRLWFYRRSLRRAREALHSAATELYRVRTARPEIADEINTFLDKELYPAIQHIRELEDALP